LLGGRETSLPWGLRSKLPKATIPVSVVVPAYNRAELLDAALSSVEAQTCSPEEIVVVDDGSDDDGVRQVAAQRGARLIRQENSGVSAARNVGVAAARHEWIAFLDADDLWLPRKLELQWSALLRTTGYGAVLTNFRTLTELGTADETAFETNEAYRSIQKRQLARDLYELSMRGAGMALARSMFAHVSTLLVQREIAMRIGGFDVGLKRCEAHDFALRVFAATRVLALENAVMRRRVTAEGLAQTEIDTRLSALALANKIKTEPERYPPGAFEAVESVKPILVRKAAAALMKDGNFVEARRLLRTIIVSDCSPKTVGLFAASCTVRRTLPRDRAQNLLGLWQWRPWKKSLRAAELTE
jgi:glycosyltransferase involved in cell wall biosynthesis